MGTGKVHFRNRILGDYAAVIFDLHRQLIVWQHALSKLQDLIKAIGP